MALTRLEGCVDYSQFGQASILEQLLPSNVPSWVVDVGAHDGITGSNSRTFVLRGWESILIEPLPAAFSRLSMNCNGLANTRLCQAACADFDGHAVLHVGSDHECQTSSLSTSGSDFSGAIVSVSVRRLTSILEEQGCPATFALLLVDAESFDLEVLRGLDFNRFKPAMIATEISTPTPQKDAEKNALLLREGYQLRGSVGWDTIWSHRELTGTTAGKHCLMEGIDGFWRGSSLPVNLPEAKGPGIAQLDAIMPAADGYLALHGWAVAGATAPALIFGKISLKDGSSKVVQSSRYPRRDVAAHFDTDDFLFSGYLFLFFISNLLDVISLTIVQSSGVESYENVLPLPLYFSRL